MFDQIKEYIDQRIDYTKLQAVDSISNIASAAVFGLLIVIFFVLIVFVASLAIGFFLGAWFDSRGFGFLGLFGIYILFILLILLFKKRIKKMITDRTVRIIIKAIKNSEKSDE